MSGSRSKPFLPLTVALLAGALTLSACGGDDSSSDATDAAEATTEAATDATTEPATEAGSEAGSDALASGDGSIWVLLPDSSSSSRWETDDRRYFEEEFDAAGVEYNIVNAENDAQQQLSQAEQAIASGAGVILFVNLDSGSGAAVIDLARQNDVAIVDYDRLTIEGPGADAYVSFDNVAVGATMAEVLEPAIDELDADTPQVVMLNGAPTDNNATLFREGYAETVEARADAGDWAVVADEAVPEWDNAEALTIFEQILVDNSNEVDAVFAANDGLAQSVIAARKSAGLDPFPVSGQDATAAGIQNILAGDQTMTVYKPIQAEAQAAAEVALALLNGEELDGVTGGTTLSNGTNDIPFVALDPVAVTVDNIADTVIADGFRTWDEICVGEYEELCPTDR